MKIISVIALIFIFQSCGKLADIKKSASDPSGLGSTNNVTPTTSSSFTPGSYFLELKDVGSSSDMGIYEFQFLSNKTFIMTVTNFAGGTISDGFYHKKTGTYTEASGVINLVVQSDSCNDLSPMRVVVTGDKKTMVTAVVNGKTMKLYSYATYFLPSNISSQLPLALEDIGCKKFQ